MVATLQCLFRINNDCKNKHMHRLALVCGDTVANRLQDADDHGSENDAEGEKNADGNTTEHPCQYRSTRARSPTSLCFNFHRCCVAQPSGRKYQWQFEDSESFRGFPLVFQFSGNFPRIEKSLSIMPEPTPTGLKVNLWFDRNLGGVRLSRIEAGTRSLEVVVGKVRQDAIRSVSWRASVMSLSIFLIDYKIAAPNSTWRQDFKKGDVLHSLWNDLNNPYQIAKLFPDPKEVFFTSGPLKNGDYGIGVNLDVLRATDIRVLIGATEVSEARELQSLAEVITAQCSAAKQRRAPQAPRNDSERLLRILGAFEAMTVEEITSSGFRLADAQKLARDGAAALVSRASCKILLPVGLGVVSAVAEGANAADEIAQYLDVSSSVVRRQLPHIRKWVVTDKEDIKLVSRGPNAVIFDWTDTLVEEFAFDEALCHFIASAETGHSVRHRKEKFQALLYKLENEQSPQWYDYVFLAKQVGISRSELAKRHRKNASLLRPLVNIDALLVRLRKHGHRVFLCTNCNSEMLKWRMRSLLVSAELFDGIVTSDLVANAQDKTQHYRLLQKKYHIEPTSCFSISDDFHKDLVPAKHLGMTTIWVKPGALRRRSEFGTPGPPMPANAGHLRALLPSPVVDFCVSSAESVIRILGAKGEVAS